jgi:osmotically-inducible protein OsmY
MSATTPGQELVHGRLDEDLVRDVGQALWDDPVLRGQGLAALHIAAREGVVTLHGHAISQVHRERAVAAARRVPGVRDVDDALVADDDLECAVAQALAGDPRTRPFHIEVHAVHGIVHLIGDVPSAEARQAAELQASTVATTRAIANHVTVRGTPGHRPPVLLPRIGSTVAARDGEVGALERVVVDPTLRRVTHLIVATRLAADGETEAAPWRVLVPADAVRDLTDAAVLLRGDRAAAAGLPAYPEEQYVAPPPDWQPPLDYGSEDVRWARRTAAAVPATAAMAGAVA